jgi:hypothetical protein
VRIVASTVVREAVKGKQSSGYVYDVDWGARQVVRRLAVPEPSFPQSDDNPRGGVRGGRGVAATPRGIAVANYDTICFFDDDWSLVETISHPLFIGMHELDWDGSHLWVSSTRIDALIKVSLEGHAELGWDPHSSPFRERFGLRARPDAVDGSVDYRVGGTRIDECHLNGVAFRDGALIVNCGLLVNGGSGTWSPRRALRKLRGGGKSAQKPHRAAVVRLNGNGSEEILLDLANGRFPTHNGQLIDETRIAVNDSAHNVLRLFALEDGRELKAIEVPGTWLRGLEPLDARTVLVGTAPAAISLVNLEDGTIEASVPLSEDPREAVHGLAVCPPQTGAQD